MKSCYRIKQKRRKWIEPWFEIKAEKLINETNTGENVNEDGEIEIEFVLEIINVFIVKIKKKNLRKKRIGKYRKTKKKFTNWKRKTIQN